MPDTTGEPAITVADQHSIRTITMARPERGNSIQGTLLADLLQSVETADRDPDVRAIVTTGMGKAYCAGGDLSVFARLTADGPLDLATTPVESVGGANGLKPLSAEQRMVDHLGTGPWVRRFMEVGTPTIAAINGAAVGGGFAIALLHDVRIMARSAKILPGFAALGLSPEMAMSWILPRLIGSENTFRVLTAAQPITSAEAQRYGIVSEVVDDDELLPAAQDIAASLTRTPDQAVRVVKRLLRQSWESTLDQQLEREWTMMSRLFRSDFTRERIVELEATLAERHHRKRG